MRVSPNCARIDAVKCVSVVSTPPPHMQIATILIPIRPIQLRQRHAACAIPGVVHSPHFWADTLPRLAGPPIGRKTRTSRQSQRRGLGGFRRVSGVHGFKGRGSSWTLGAGNECAGFGESGVEFLGSDFPQDREGFGARLFLRLGGGARDGDPRRDVRDAPF